ncbi:MAG: AarF/ABC1/UbiB kinase family protein [Deltaproteobacteria bacterium]|nr:AarF/ABC1/UbiB kinase family protein [Deltaproteobacteria bacterium]
MSNDDHVQSGRLARMAKIAKVGARTAADMLAARARQKLGSDDATIAESLKPTAERLVEVLGEMKGVATKVGQFVSLVDQENFPEEARKALHRLLNQTPQRMEWDQVQAVVRGELGGNPEEIFAAFDREPLASASMGQVHGATTRDGQDVVVKIQYPGVDKAIESDLRNAGAIARTLSLAGGVLESRHYFEELAAVLRRELDYQQEIAQAEVYRDALQPWPDLVVPEFRRDLSTQRMLTMERLRGPTMLEAAQDDATPADVRFRIGAQLVAATWGPFLRQGVIHADPHPGNYIALPGGRLGVLDFGATKTLSVPFAHAYWRLLDAAFRREVPDVYGALVSAGFDMQLDKAAADVWLLPLTATVERPFQTDWYDWGKCRISADVQALTRKHPLIVLKVRAPEESLMFYRSAAGAAGDLRLLRSAGNFRTTLIGTACTAWQHRSAPMAQGLDLPVEQWN